MARSVRDTQPKAPPEEVRGAPGAPPHDVFVSYCTRDKPVADAIVSRLEQAGIRCWVAPRDVIPGQVWGEAIVKAIETSRMMVVVLSGEANESSQIVREVERAFANNVVVVPFRIESIEPSRALSYFLGSEHWLDAITPPLDAHISTLAEVALALAPIRLPAVEEAQVPEVKEEVAEQPAPLKPTLPPVAAPPRAPGTRRRRRFLVPMVVAGGLLLAGAIAGAVMLLTDGGPEPAAQVEEEPLVVEPFPAEPPDAAAPATQAGVEAPTGLRAVYATSSEVKLIWDRAGGSRVDHFRVYRDGDPVGKPLETRSFVDDDVDPGARYRYRVVAFGVDGSRASSEALAVEIPTPPPQASSQAPSQAPSQGSSDKPQGGQCDVVVDEGVCIS